MKKNSTQTIISIAALIVGFGLIFVLSNFIQSQRPNISESYTDEDLALQGTKLKGYTLGFEGLIADWYWIQSLQYVGEKFLKTKENISLDNLKPLNPRLLYPLLDNATDLDPHFSAAYSYGAIVLPAIDTEQAIKITEKGVAANPNDWQMYQHLGYIYWRLKNYEKAAEIYEKGSKIEGAPSFMQMMTALMKTQGENRSTARAIYEQMLSNAQDTQTKQFAETRLTQIESLEERDVIRAGLQKFKEQNNRCVNNWSELFPLLKSLKLPNGKDFRIDKSNNLVDPSGAAYILDKEACDVKLDRAKTKIPLE